LQIYFGAFKASIDLDHEIEQLTMMNNANMTTIFGGDKIDNANIKGNFCFRWTAFFT
jgi:hypothetical protein